MREIRDPLAVASLEEVLAHDNDLALLLVETLAAIDEPRAVEALVRLAVDSESAAVCAAATSELRRLDLYSYVPVLLSGLRGPIAATSVLKASGGQRPVYTQNLRRAADEHDEVLEINILVNRRGTAVNAANSNGTLRNRAEEEDDRLQLAVLQENRKIESRNERIIEVLKKTTGQHPHEQPALNNGSVSPYALASGLKATASPQPWWDWWSARTKSTSGAARGVMTFHRTSSVAISDRFPNAEAEPIPSSYRSSSEFRSPRIQQRSECFVAGTPVWTSRGKLAIEQIRTGELVLAQNLETGELEFKPVVRPTMRPAGLGTGYDWQRHAGMHGRASVLGGGAGLDEGPRPPAGNGGAWRFGQCGADRAGDRFDQADVQPGGGRPSQLLRGRVATAYARQLAAPGDESNRTWPAVE